MGNTKNEMNESEHHIMCHYYRIAERGQIESKIPLNQKKKRKNRKTNNRREEMEERKKKRKAKQKINIRKLKRET